MNCTGMILGELALLTILAVSNLPKPSLGLAVGTGQKLARSSCKLSIVTDGIWEKGTRLAGKSPSNYNILGYSLQWMMKPRCAEPFAATVGALFHLWGQSL